METKKTDREREGQHGVEKKTRTRRGTKRRKEDLARVDGGSIVN